MLKGIDRALWERIRGATIEGYLGTQSKVLQDFTRACVYPRDYRDLDDLRRVLKCERRRNSPPSASRNGPWGWRRCVVVSMGMPHPPGSPDCQPRFRGGAGSQG
ncbi:DUF1917 domain-containing protein (plasmid) [Streptomyces zaomyceticus]|uniref:DUF1917 domain-containing protein n=1 Tax=Streptomyces zaomyceticus TaxID=68286 RepID=A0ABZ1LT01_9ACTN